MNNQPAFPTLHQDRVYKNFLTTDGMTLRDYFAAKAMQALIQKYSHEGDVSRNAYILADAMLKAREKNNGHRDANGK